MRRVNRRIIALCSLILLGLSGAAGTSSANAEAVGKIEFVTLGTGGGPRVQTNRSQPANAVIVGQDVYLFDVGEGTQRQLKLAGIALQSVKGIFLSHHHIDHIGGLWPLLVNRWVQGDYEQLPIYGPPLTAQMIGALVAAARPVQIAPVALGVDLPDIASTVKPVDMASDMETPTVIFDENGVRVLAIANDHYHFPPDSESWRNARSYAFRIEVAGASIVYSGDTGPSARLETLAKEADLLVSEVIDLKAIRTSLAQSEIPDAIREGVMKHLGLNHLTPRQVGAMARRANVRRVALTHLVPGLDTDENEMGYTDGLASEFRGPIAVARDGQRFTLTLSISTEYGD